MPRGRQWWVGRLAVCRHGIVFRVYWAASRHYLGLDAAGRSRQTAHPRVPTAAERRAYQAACRRQLAREAGPIIDATVRRLQVLADAEVSIDSPLPLETRSTMEWQS